MGGQGVNILCQDSHRNAQMPFRREVITISTPHQINKISIKKKKNLIAYNTWVSWTESQWLNLRALCLCPSLSWLWCCGGPEGRDQSSLLSNPNSFFICPELTLLHDAHLPGSLEDSVTVLELETVGTEGVRAEESVNDAKTVLRYLKISKQEGQWISPGLWRLTWKTCLPAGISDHEN